MGKDSGTIVLRTKLQVQEEDVTWVTGYDGPPSYDGTSKYCQMAAILIRKSGFLLQIGRFPS